LGSRRHARQLSISAAATASATVPNHIAIEVKGAAKGTPLERVVDLKGNTSVSDLVKALNAIGAQPKDLTAIFQTLKQIGALQADLEIM
jgi:flagellar basal body P-ring protein FlgI